MKKNHLKLASVVLSTAIAFSSCLGDNDNVYEATNDFVYISSESGVTYAAVSAYAGLFCTSDAIQQLSPGSCYFMSYKLSTSDMASGNLFKAQNVSLSKEITQSSQLLLQESEQWQPLDNEVYPTSLSLNTYNAGQIFGDKWLFSANITKAADDKMAIKVYLDTKNQFTDAAKEKPVGKNQIILDVLLHKSLAIGAEGSKSDFSFVNNLSLLREYLMSAPSTGTATEPINIVLDSEKYTEIQILFRYRKAKDATYEAGFYPESWSNRIIMAVKQAE